MSKPVITDWTYDHLVKQYADFLVICIHAICFYRRLYDRKFFTLTRAYNCPVQKCMHPMLADYINAVVSAVAEELRKGTVGRVYILILDSQEAVLERFVFDVHSLPVVAPEDLFLPYVPPLFLSFFFWMADGQVPEYRVPGRAAGRPISRRHHEARPDRDEAGPRAGR